MTMQNPLNQALGLDFYDLYSCDGLQKVEKKFYEFFAEKNADTYREFLSLKNSFITSGSDENAKKVSIKFDETIAAKSCEAAVDAADITTANHFSKKQQAEILINAAQVVEDFLVYLLDIEKENSALKKEHADLQKIYFVKREFVQRIVAKKFKEIAAEVEMSTEAEAAKITEKFFNENKNNEQENLVTSLEKSFAQKIFSLLEKEKSLNEVEQKEYESLILYAAWALYSVKGKLLHENGALFKLPQKIDHQKLFNYQKEGEGTYSIKHSDNHQRDGFNLTDKGFSLNQTLAESHYCIFCHNQQKDSCRTGIKEKPPQDRIKDDEKIKSTELASFFKTDPLGLELHGCPLDQKISEMNLLKSKGFSLAALAMAALDNPLLAGTGHRICNDCMKSCIFQKQDPVNIPQIESENLRDILKLPYGFEIYSLLTRWNPLNLTQPIPQKNSGKKILIAGLGPAGYTLAHYLLNDGHTIVAIDGLKIEPLKQEISGIDSQGVRHKFKPIKFLDEICEPLSSRLIQGFGGVAEYGITVRWDKNFLQIIRLLLERRANFRMFGGIRFGSSITDKIAFDEYGFDHVALCIGAGRPNIINIKNNYAKGIRSASDFLMSLQLSGAFKEELFTNLQIRMPIAVIGGGLTAVDAACEAQEYYFTQIKKFASQFAKLKTIFGEEKIWSELNAEEKIIAQEFLDHHAEVTKHGRLSLLQKIDSVKILYRKKIQDAPAYRLNHQELEAALKEGITFITHANPREAMLDEFGNIKAIKCDDERIFSCKTLLIAAGTTPNLAPVLEDGLDFKLEGKYFAAIDKNGRKIDISHTAKPLDFSVFTKIDDQNRAVSFFGDLHPNFEGNVVKAMSSAKEGHKMITNLLAISKYSSTNLAAISATSIAADDQNIKTEESLRAGQQKFFQKITQDFFVKIKAVNLLSDNLVEVLISAPLIAKQAKLGQIFRLQNYHAFAKKVDGQLLAMEGVPLTALSIDPVAGIISAIAIETGGSASLIKNFKPNDPAVFMGPSGNPTEVIANETVILIGGGRGNVPLVAIARAHKAQGCKIIFCAGYRKNSYIYRQEEMEKVSDVLVFAIEEEKPSLNLNRPQDQQYQGTIVDAVKKYLTQDQQKIDRIFTIGNDKMMHAIARLRHENAFKNFSDAPIAITSLNAPMQCMLKGVCSQCLQKRKNEKGEEEYFYSCAKQDQDLDKLDFKHLHNRCEQNSLQEKMTKMWLKSIA